VKEQNNVLKELLTNNRMYIENCLKIVNKDGELVRFKLNDGQIIVDNIIKDLEARNKLIEHNLRLVAHIVKKYSNMERESEDLISIGTIGLIKAIDTYDVSKGNKLVTYASRCIENELLMLFRKEKNAPGKFQFMNR
jgi:DNA-directed RNA polymerase specialized sigma subunit